MGWSIGFDTNWKRDVGYCVPAVCDHPECNEKIDRGLSYVCGGRPFGGEHGCGLFFCGNHTEHHEIEDEWVALCECCSNKREPFEPKADVSEWRNWKRTHESWAKWREENPELAAAL